MISSEYLLTQRADSLVSLSTCIAALQFESSSAFCLSGYKKVKCFIIIHDFFAPNSSYNINVL